MKIIYLTLAIYAHAYVVLGASTERNPGRTLENMVQDKCFENSHSTSAFQNFDEAGHNFIQCQEEAFDTPAPHPVEQHDEFCGYYRENGFYTCMKNLAGNVLPCLDKTELFFPHMMLKAYNITYNELCGTNGLVKTEYIFNKLKKNWECIREVKASIILGGRCVENLTGFNNFFRKNIIDLNKHDYCIDMESFVSCATEAVEEECNDDFSLIADIISELFLGVCK